MVGKMSRMTITSSGFAGMSLEVILTGVLDAVSKSIDRLIYVVRNIRSRNSFCRGSNSLSGNFLPVGVLEAVRAVPIKLRDPGAVGGALTYSGRGFIFSCGSRRLWAGYAITLN